MAAKQQIKRKLRVSADIADLIRGSHPHLKKKIKAGLDQILAAPEAGKSLKDELTGLRSLRVSRFRIIYRISTKNMIEVVTIGPRKTIYEETFRIIKKTT